MVNSSNVITVDGRTIPATNPSQVDKGASIVVTKDNYDALFGNTGLSLNQNLANKNGTAAGTQTIAPLNSSLAARLDALDITWNSVPNPLNVYDNYTYHIRWSLTSESDAYNLDAQNPNGDNITKTVIAESGVTAGFNIEELRLKAFTTANQSKRNMWASMEFTMILNEPQGLSLLDKIYYAGQEIGIINHMRCPYLLEIWFRGYNEDGDMAPPRLFYNLYRIAVAKVEAVATYVGTKYHVHGYVDGAIGEMNQIATLPSTVKVIAKTVGEFFRGLESAWNKLAKQMNHDSVQRITYKIVYPPAWDKWSLKNPEIEKQNARTVEMKAEINGELATITIPMGTSIEAIVNFVLYISPDAQRWIVGIDPGNPNGLAGSSKGMINFATVHTQTKITGFDPVTKDYTREVSYLLTPTESGRGFTDLKTQEKLKPKSTQLEKLKYILQAGRLQKKYDYIYTGLNTEVLRFDFKIDNYWAIVQPNFNQLNSYDQVTVGPKADPNSIGYQANKGTLPTDQNSIKNRINEIDRIITQVTGQDPKIAQSLLGEKAQLQRSLLSQIGKAAGGTTQQAIDAALSQTSPSMQPNNLVQFNNGQIQINPGALLDPYTAKVVKQQLLYSQRQQQLATKFVEDYRYDASINVPPLPPVGLYDSRPNQQNAIQTGTVNKVPAQRDPQGVSLGTGFVGAVFGNLFETQSGAFLEIEIEIRGDPWWLPVSNLIQDQRALQLIGSNGAPQQPPLTNAADFLAGENSFILELRAGIVIDESTGLVDQAESGDFFNGIYNVREVDSIFSKGKFTQVLKANKDVLSQEPINPPDDSVKSTTVVQPPQANSKPWYQFGF
jgi:hypothetical protein